MRTVCVPLQLQSLELEVLRTGQELKGVREQGRLSEEGWVEKEAQLEAQQSLLKERVDSLTQQNDTLHKEAEKVGNRS